MKGRNSEGYLEKNLNAILETIKNSKRLTI